MRLMPLMLLSAIAPALADPGFGDELAQWQQQRHASLTKADGWTALVALHWLEPNTGIGIGSAAENQLVVPGLPSSWGRLQPVDGGWRLEVSATGNVEIDGEPMQGEAVDLVSDAQAASAGGRASRVRFGGVQLALIERSGRHALRVWDADAPTRTGFAGLSHYPGDPAWRVSARWLPHDPIRSLDIATVVNTIEPMANPGALEFEHDGRRHRLEALQEAGSDQLFVIFADRTSGRGSYGAGRYLYAPLPADDGTVVLDFNRAYNPPCAFTAHATCPLPPPENRLDLAVKAGERRYDGPTSE